MKHSKALNENLFLALEDINEELIQKAAPTYTKNTFRLIWRKIPVLIAIPVCLLALVLFSFFKNPNSNIETIPKELPIITITNNNGNGTGGYNYEVLVKDYSELRDANPWSEEEEIATLPVFKNLDFPIYQPHIEKMIDKTQYFNQLLLKMKEIAYRLAEDSDTLTIELENDSITIKGNGFRIHSFSLYDICLEFQPTIPLPKEYGGEFASYEELEKVATYFKTEYQELIHMPSATANIRNLYYGFDGNPISSKMEFYNAEGSIEEQILNYNFHTIQFIRDQQGNLWLVRFKETDLSEKIGDYPLITLEEAKELLLNGNFINLSSNEFPQENAIITTKLVYDNFPTTEYFIPYYCFYIAWQNELPEYVEDKTLLRYDCYYVPAICSDLIKMQ